MKKAIHYIGGARAGFDQKWGGTCATNYALVKAMADHSEIELVARFRRDFANISEVAGFLALGDLAHVDDTDIITRMYHEGLPPPHVIGPITRSPLKDYGGWRAAYTPEWFYRARIIRLNYSEERHHRSLVSLIRHGVDTELLRPGPATPRRFVLWAGESARPAKNYPFMQEIVSITQLPPGYEFRMMSGYIVGEYWRALDDAALVVNTSKYESFCCAAFEAMAKGVPVIWRENLQGGVHEAAGLRLAYHPEEYRLGILAALKNQAYREIGLDCRRYVEAHASLAVMREDLAAVYREALGRKGNYILDSRNQRKT